jgi:hypothetical protein
LLTASLVVHSSALADPTAPGIASSQEASAASGFEDAAATAESRGPASMAALDTMAEDAALSLAETNAADREVLAGLRGTVSSPMGLILSPHSGLPTFLGGPGFAVGQFDLSADPLDIVEAVLARWNFLEMAQPREELELVRDRQNPVTRVLTFRQRLWGVPLHESRLVFEFDGAGRLTHFGGEYYPPALEASPSVAPSCETMRGAADELGNEVFGCSAVYSRANRFTGRPDGVLTPVLVLSSLTDEGDEETSYWNEVTAEFQRPADHNTIYDRKIYKNFTAPPPPEDLVADNYTDDMFSGYMLNETCVWEWSACGWDEVNRITNDAYFYAAYLHGWLDRHSVDGNDYRVKVFPVRRGGSWVGSESRVYVDVWAQISTLGHEFSHGVINHAVPVTYNGMGDQLGDAFGNMIAMQKTGSTGHWCYHNYPGDPDQEECTWDHVYTTNRCTMLSGDTVGYFPDWGPYQGSVASLSPGIAFNVLDPAPYGYESPAPVSKAFELFNLDKWIDPNAGVPVKEYCNGGQEYDAMSGAPVNYFNGFALWGAMSLEKTAKWWHRFVTTYLSGVGERHWSTAGPNLIAAAWSLFNDGTFTVTERDKATRSVQAAGLRSGSSVIPGHLGSRLRQAAFFKGTTLFLFYSRPTDNRIVYQKLPYRGTWSAPVAFASASTGMGLEAYLHTNGETRIVFHPLGTSTLAYLVVSPYGVVSPSVHYYGCGLFTYYAPSAIHDGTRELIFTTANDGTVRTTRLDTCATIVSSGIPRVRGVSVARYNSQTYLIGTVKSGQAPWDNHQVIARLNPGTFQFVHLSSSPGAPDLGYITCRSYVPNDGCFDFLNPAGTTPNLFGVSMPVGREGYARIYAGWASVPQDFRITRLGIEVFNGPNYRPTRRTRILPTDSSDPVNTSEVEFLQDGASLLVFEHNQMHSWLLY